MRVVDDSNITAARQPDAAESRVSGVWTLTGSGPIIAEPDGPATLLVPTEQVLLLSVDLPLANRAKRLEALPFAIEDRIAEPLDSVHLALGAELSPKRYLVGVVRHATMAGWVAQAEDAGLDQAAMVPDALLLPVPEAGWTVASEQGRALVRAEDGTGFALPETMLRAGWEAAGEPAVTGLNGRGANDLPVASVTMDSRPLSERLATPALDLRQGAYARRRMAASTVWRKVAWIVALGAAAHAVIALADTAMLRVIADRRAAETRALVTAMAPGVNLGDDPATAIADLLPSGTGGAPQTFVPLLTRVSAALAPGGAVAARAIAFEGETLILDFDPADGLAARIRAALAGARVQANVTESPDGAVRVTARNA